MRMFGMSNRLCDECRCMPSCRLYFSMRCVYAWQHGPANGHGIWAHTPCGNLSMVDLTCPVILCPLSSCMAKYNELELRPYNLGIHSELMHRHAPASRRMIHGFVYLCLDRARHVGAMEVSASPGFVQGPCKKQLKCVTTKRSFLSTFLCALIIQSNTF